MHLRLAALAASAYIYGLSTVLGCCCDVSTGCLPGWSNCCVPYRCAERIWGVGHLPLARGWYKRMLGSGVLPGVLQHAS
jgi:hypothetical protein